MAIQAVSRPTRADHGLLGRTAFAITHWFRLPVVALATPEHQGSFFGDLVSAVAHKDHVEGDVDILRRLTKYIGCYTAYGVFFWRYWNVPQNWGYVGSTWSIGTIVLTLIPETIYPFYYVYLYLKTKKKLE